MTDTKKPLIAQTDYRFTVAPSGETNLHIKGGLSCHACHSPLQPTGGRRGAAIYVGASDEENLFNAPSGAPLYWLDPNYDRLEPSIGPDDLILLAFSLARLTVAGIAALLTKRAPAALPVVQPLNQSAGYLQRGVALQEAKAAMAGAGHAGRTTTGGFNYTADALKNPPAFLFSGSSGMVRTSDAGIDAMYTMQFYGNTGEVLSRYAHKFGKTLDYSMSDIAQIYFPRATGRVLTFSGDDVVAGMSYQGSVSGVIRHVKDGARPIGMSPTPRGFDDAGNAVYHWRDYSVLGPGHPVMQLQRAR